MKTYLRRKTYFPSNKYQRQIIGLTFLPTFIISLLISVMLIIFYRELINVILYKSIAPSVQFVNRWGIFILSGLWGVFMLILIWGFYISKNLVGAFERIIREMDDIIAGKDKKQIKARTEDGLANELLKRINILIQGYSGK